MSVQWKRSGCILRYLAEIPNVKKWSQGLIFSLQSLADNTSFTSYLSITTELRDKRKFGRNFVYVEYQAYKHFNRTRIKRKFESSFFSLFEQFGHCFAINLWKLKRKKWMEVIKTHFIADLCSIKLEREKINCSLKMQKWKPHCNRSQVE